MQSIYWLLGLLFAVIVALFFLMEQRWRKRLEEIKTDSSSQPMWTLMQQQMEQLRGQLGDGLNKNISLLTEQLRVNGWRQRHLFGHVFRCGRQSLSYGILAGRNKSPGFLVQFLLVNPHPRRFLDQQISP